MAYYTRERYSCMPFTSLLNNWECGAITGLKKNLQIVIIEDCYQTEAVTFVIGTVIVNSWQTSIEEAGGKKNIYTALLTSDLLLVQSLQKLEAKLPLDENYANKIKTEVRLSSRERGLSSTYVFLKHHSIMKN